MLACSGDKLHRADIDPSTFTYNGPGQYRGEYGEANCLEGYAGYRCASCRVTVGTDMHGVPADGDPEGNGFYRLDKRCHACGTPFPAWILGVAGLIAFLAIALTADRVLSKVKNLSQVLAPILILLTFFRARIFHPSVDEPHVESGAFHSLVQPGLLSLLTNAVCCTALL